MINKNRLLISFVFLFLFTGCNVSKDKPSDKLFDLFQDPPQEARPFVRWWWNGSCIEKDELQRELDVMKAAGIGGVEINPIAHPENGTDFDYKCYDWLSPEWNERVRATIEMTGERNMIADIIMGSGWPFGGEFLSEDQFLQGVGIRKMVLQGPRELTLQIKDVWKKPGKNFGQHANPSAPDPELFFLRMVPHGAKGVTEVVDLMSEVDEQGMVKIRVPEGKHDLYIGTTQKAYRTVMHGAPGSSGPVVNHYDEEDVRAYMDKLADALEAVLGGKLGDHFRALFCDSIELSGANLTDDFFVEFKKRRGYSLDPYLPLVYYAPYEGYTDTLHYDLSFNKDIRRIRYDFNKTLVELFLERFTQTFDSWANEHGMQSRYQAYGTPWLMGMLDGYRLVDIPESNNWLFSRDAKSHGYWIWNKYCSSGAHLSGAKIVSSEAMTNTSGVFRTTLNMIKKNDDFNFISGINHSVLHGFNYSPPEAGFPGWVRYGAYFSDQNTWWPYFHYWTDYNSRLSAVFQNSEPVVDIAILTPEADIWKQWGLWRELFYKKPWYNHDLWEGFSRQGITADYINEGVIQRAEAEQGMMKSEQSVFQLIIISGANTVESETAKSIYELAKQGVPFLFIDHLPSEAPSFFEKEKNDKEVKKYMEKIYALDNVNIIGAPLNAEEITEWTARLSNDYNVNSNVQIEPLNDNLYTVKYKYENSDIFFFSSQDDKHFIDFSVTFNQPDKTAWCWDPESGERFIYSAGENGKLNVNLKPLESLLIVLEDRSQGKVRELISADNTSGLSIGEEWKMVFEPAQGETFEISAPELFDFPSSKDQRISTFAGKVHYYTTFDLENHDWDFLDLGLESHVTEVVLNGQNIGTKWWGRHLYELDERVLKEGKNELEIIYTTTLANYANSLNNNKVAKRWIRLRTADPMGLNTNVKLMKKK